MIVSRIALCLALASGVPVAAHAQPRGSERGGMMQVVNGTRIIVDFGRPVARGRDNLFGGVVPWGEVWTPGANWATTLEFDRPVTLDGHAVQPGRYSVWLEPKEEGAWQLSLNSEWRLYHDAPVPDDGFVLHFDVSPHKGAQMEALNWYVDSINSRGATLRMHWGDTFISVEIETEEYTWDALPASERASYVGSYAFDTSDPTTGGPMAVTIGVLEENGRIVGRWGSVPVALVPAGPAEFWIGFMRNGALFDVAKEMTIRILNEAGESTGAELLWEGDVFAVGEKAR